jgi:hypothetical protein
VAVPVAHAGHWLPYVIPGLIVLVAVVIASVRERRRAAAGDSRD